MDPTTTLPSYIGGAIRTAFAMLGGFLIAKGYLTTEQIPEATGFVVGLGTLAWSLSHKAGVAKAIQAALTAGKTQ